MVRDRTIASSIGMALGVIVVTGAALAAGISLFPALALSLIGLALGGWLAERQYLRRSSGDSTRSTGTA
jgi:superfamily II helicase